MKKSALNLIKSKLQNKEDSPRYKIVYVLLGISFIWFVVLAAFAIARHQRLNSSAYDLAIKSQVIWNTYQGNWFASSIEVGHYLGDHVQLIMLLLSPLFALWEDVRILLIAQSLLLSLAAIPVYFIARRQLHSVTLALTFAVVYLLYPTIGFVNRFDFHPIVFTILFLLLAYDFLERKRPFLATLFILLALSCREDVGFTVFAFGLYAAFVMKRPKLGIVWAVTGLAWSLTAVFVIIPHFRGVSSDTLARYSWLGTSVIEMVETVIFQPKSIVMHIFGEPFRREFIFKLLLPVGFLSLLSPLPLLIGLPALTYNLLSSTPSQSAIYFQYMSPAIPFIFIAGIQGVVRLQRWLSMRLTQQRATSVIIMWVSISLFVAWMLDNPFTKEIDTPYFPVYALEQVTNGDAFWSARTMLPNNASTATMMAYAPHVALRLELHLFQDRAKMEERPFGFPQTEYLLLNLSDWRWGVNGRLFAAAIETAIGHFGYEAVFYRDDVVLLTQTPAPQPATGDLLQRVLQLQEEGGKYAPAAESTIKWMGQQWVLDSLPDTAVSHPAPFEDNINLLGYTINEHANRAGRPLCVTMYWQTTVPSSIDYTVFLHFTADDGYVHAQRDAMPAFNFYPTTQWQSEEIIADMHCLQIPSYVMAGEYTIVAGLYDPVSGNRLSLANAADVSDAVKLTTIMIQ